MHSAFAWSLLVIPLSALFFRWFDKTSDYFASVEVEIEQIEAELTDIASIPPDGEVSSTHQFSDSQLGRLLKVVKAAFPFVYSVFAVILVWGFVAILIVSVVAALLGF